MKSDIEEFDNGIVDATCVFKNVPINIVESTNGGTVDPGFDIDPEDVKRKFRRF